jgi:hypothetical protein
MTEVALLNPQLEAELAKRLINMAHDALKRCDATLCSTQLTQDLYLKEFGARTALNTIYLKMKTEYERTLNT